MSDELDRKRPSVAQTSGGGETPAPLEGDPARRGPEHGVREGTRGDEPPGRDTRPDRATRFLETTRGTLSYSEIAPLLAEQVVRVETMIYGAEWEAHPSDERLAAGFHRAICGDLVPDWAGKWRSLEVRVGNLQPPLPHRISVLMRDYGADLAARGAQVSSALDDLTLEFLAFTEGRFLSIHPFTNFNGRTIRLFLLELLRRLDLPRVVLAPESEGERQAYFRALEAADHADWEPLAAIWQHRLASSKPPTW